MKKLTSEQRNFLRLVDRDDLRHMNSVRINPANSEKHEIIKARLAYELRKVGINFVTEARVGKNRIDLFDINGIAYEVAVSESQESLDTKKRAYKWLGIKMVVIKPNLNSSYEYYVEEEK